MNIKQYNQRLENIDHRIIILKSPKATSLSLVTMNPNAGFMEKLMKINISDEIFTSQDFSKVAKEADTIIASYGSGLVGVK